MVGAYAPDGVVCALGGTPAAQVRPSGDWPSAMKDSEPRPLRHEGTQAFGPSSVALLPGAPRPGLLTGASARISLASVPGGRQTWGSRSVQAAGSGGAGAALPNNHAIQELRTCVCCLQEPAVNGRLVAGLCSDEGEAGFAPHPRPAGETGRQG